MVLFLVVDDVEVEEVVVVVDFGLEMFVWIGVVGWLGVEQVFGFVFQCYVFVDFVVECYVECYVWVVV